MASTDLLLGVLRQIAVRLTIATVALTVIGAAVGLAVSGSAGLWGALLGGLAGVIFCGTTALSMIAAVGRPPQLIAIIVLGLWLVKMIVLIGMLALLNPHDFYDRMVFAGVLVAIVLASLAIDVHALLRARIPAVDPGLGTS